MADWIAYAVRTWAEGRRKGYNRLGQIRSRFRGHPDNVVDGGIALVPDHDRFPELPLT